MEETSSGQVTRDAAEIYDGFFLPALFAEWAPRLCDAAEIRRGDKVLDVACGTGALALEAARRAGSAGKVSGLDRNEGMLVVARRKAPHLEWRAGSAEALPFADGTFDVVASQFGLMFFEDRVAALREMWRVLRPGGRLAVAVWDAVENTPGYAAMIALLQRLFGAAIADELRAPFILGDRTSFRELFAKAGIDRATVETLPGTARFPSIEAWVHTDVRGWTLADRIDDAQYRTLLAAAERDLAPLRQADGRVVFAAPAHIATATKA